MILQVLIAMIAGWLQRHQQQVIAYLHEENRVLKAQLGSQRLRLTDIERRRLAALAHPIGRRRLKELTTIATPDTLLRWHNRLMTDPFEGFLLGKRYLIHDRDTKFTQAFDTLLKDSGVEPVLLPPRSPNLNAYCERFVRSIKEEVLNQMVMLGERALSYAIQQYLAHYHMERNHQGLDKQLIAPAPDLARHSGQVRRRDRLGRLLHYSYRDVA